MNEEHNFDEKKICKKCYHQRRDHKYNITEQNNDLKCKYSNCECNHFVEWI